MAKKESGIDFNDKIRFRETENGYEIIIYFRVIREVGNPLRIKLDITKRGNEIVVLPIYRRKVIHPYSDDYDAKIKVYSLEEIFAEKIRSLFQRTRPRDLYDVWYLSKENLRLDFNIIERIFKFKEVKADLDGLLERKDQFKNAWKSSLRHQLKELPEFNVVFTEAVNYLRGIFSR